MYARIADLSVLGHDAAGIVAQVGAECRRRVVDGALEAGKEGASDLPIYRSAATGAAPSSPAPCCEPTCRIASLCM
jgi:hypothetical protein